MYKAKEADLENMNVDQIITFLGVSSCRDEELQEKLLEIPAKTEIEITEQNRNNCCSYSL